VEYRVIWDGRKNGPGGSYLRPGLKEAPAEPPVLRQIGRGEYSRSAVLYALRHGDKSKSELVRQCGLTQDAVNVAIRELKRVGAIEAVGEQPRAGAVWGPRVETIYRIR
jgi:hypothetical protein